MKVFDKLFVNKLYEQATLSSRKRSHYLLHKDHQEKVQRLFIALLKDSYVPPHYHEQSHQWELFVVLEGCLEVCIYDKSTKNVTRSLLVGPAQDVSSIELQPLEVHSVRCVSDQALMLEIKEGPFNQEYTKMLE